MTTSYETLIQIIDLFSLDDRVVGEVGVVEIGLFHGEGRNLMVVVGCVIENTLFEIVAGSIEGMFVFVVAEVAAAVLLVDGVENVEELADAGHLVIGGNGVELGEGGFGIARFGREVAWEANGTHAAAISREIIGGSEFVLGSLGGKMLVVAELEALLVERRVVGQDADGIVVDLEAVFDGFDDDTSASSVGNLIVELGSGELITKIDRAEIHFVQESFGFFDGGTLAENPRDKFELSDVVLAVDMVVVDGVADEIETGDAQALLVDGVIEQRIVLRLASGGVGRGVFGDVGDAGDGIVAVQDPGFTEVEREVAGNDDRLLAIGNFIVEIAPKIVIFGLVCGSCTHFLSFLF